MLLLKMSDLLKDYLYRNNIMLIIGPHPIFRESFLRQDDAMKQVLLIFIVMLQRKSRL